MIEQPHKNLGYLCTQR